MSDLNDALFHLKSLARGGNIVNPQQAVERRMLHFMAEFPDLVDEGVATLARDEILNLAGNEPALLRWATPETAARLRRTILLEVLRQQQRALEPPRPTSPSQVRRVEPPAFVPTDNTALKVVLAVLAMVLAAFVWAATCSP